MCVSKQVSSVSLCIALLCFAVCCAVLGARVFFAEGEHLFFHCG